jgi:hypothetical protein
VGGGLHLLREDALDHITELTYRRDWQQIPDDIEHVIQQASQGSLNRNKLRNRVIVSCYELIGNLAWQAVALQESRTDKVTLYHLLAQAFEAVL